MQIVFGLVCLFGIALSVKSVLVLEAKAPWTAAGWWLTVVYFIAAILRATVAPSLPSLVEYAALAALALAFVVAGVRDEPQSEPWWWPNHRGVTRAEKRRAT